STKQNVDAREKVGFELEELPKTLRDVVLITRRLGIPYLWIDALCIIQDNTADWEAESDQMMHYYGDAYLTLVPVEPDDVNRGIRHDPADRLFLRTFPGPWSHGGSGSNEPRLILADAGSRYYDGTLFDSTWSRRGWTYQEILISARILFIFSYNLTLVCRTVLWDNLKGLQKLPVLPTRFLPAVRFYIQY
ncbi:Heterokaryon incompatibility protein (HET) domain containing protein, partial [Rhypophila decipiens]